MRSFLILAGAAAIAAARALSSCANQGEGERCDILAGNGGNDDCSEGLVCTPADQLRWPVTTDGGIAQTPQTNICCPQNRTQAKAPVCQISMAPIGSDASIPEAGPDAGTDAPADAPADTPSDSPIEADAPADAAGD